MRGNRETSPGEDAEVAVPIPPRPVGPGTRPGDHTPGRASWGSHTRARARRPSAHVDRWAPGTGKRVPVPVKTNRQTTCRGHPELKNKNFFKGGWGTNVKKGPSPTPSPAPARPHQAPPRGGPGGGWRWEERRPVSNFNRGNCCGSQSPPRRTCSPDSKDRVPHIHSDLEDILEIPHSTPGVSSTPTPSPQGLKPTRGSPGGTTSKYPPRGRVRKRSPRPPEVSEHP